MNDNFVDRRKFHRVSFDGRVHLQFSRREYDHLQVKDISLTGMFVKGKIRHRQMENCHITIFHKDKTGNNCLKALGEIVWSNEEGAGLKFSVMTVESYILLQSTLIHHTEQPAILLREFPEDCPFEVATA